MNKILLSMAAVSAIAIGTPAMAQQGGYGLAGDTRIDVRIGELQSRIQAGVQSGAISRQEAQPLRMQLRDLTRLERQFAVGGLSRAERQELQGRVQQLRQQIRSAEMSGDGRWDRDSRGGQGWDRDCPPGLEKRNNGCTPPGQQGRDGRWEDRRGDRDDRYEDGRYEDDGRYASPYDRNRDGYDDRDTNRDNRVDSRDGAYERDGEYRDRDYRDGDYRDGERRRGGIVGQVIDRVIGGGGLRVGQRVSGNLGALPYEYRDRYRDGNGAYYRTDGRNIYRIDARTDVVLQVHAMNR
jgi:hypothetical protein